jgi:hypothetical protein
LKDVKANISRTLPAYSSVPTDTDGFAPDLLLDFLTSKIQRSGSRADTKSVLIKELICAIWAEKDSICHDPAPLDRTRLKRLRLRFLQSLEYRGMRNRESNVVDAYHNTFRWIFESNPDDKEKWMNFKDWLQSENSQLYWITGKAGSGKSTLMKYIGSRDHR